MRFRDAVSLAARMAARTLNPGGLVLLGAAALALSVAVWWVALRPAFGAPPWTVLLLLVLVPLAALTGLAVLNGFDEARSTR